SPAALRAPLVVPNAQVGVFLARPTRGVGALRDRPLEPLFLDDEQLGVLGSDHRRRAVPAAEECHLAERLALADPVHDPLDAVEVSPDLDRAGVDYVCLVVGVVALLEDDVAPLESPPLDVAEREVLVELEPDRWQRRLRLDRQARVGPAAEAALQDAHGLEAPLPEDLSDPGALLLLRARAVRDDHLRRFEVDRGALGLLGRQARRARQL